MTCEGLLNRSRHGLGMGEPVSAGVDDLADQFLNGCEGDLFGRFRLDGKGKGRAALRMMSTVPGGGSATPDLLQNRRPLTRVRNHRVGNWRLAEGSSLSKQRLWAQPFIAPQGEIAPIPHRPQPASENNPKE